MQRRGLNGHHARLLNELKKGSRTGLLISSLYINRCAQESPAFSVAVCE